MCVCSSAAADRVTACVVYAFVCLWCTCMRERACVHLLAHRVGEARVCVGLHKNILECVCARVRLCVCVCVCERGMRSGLM